MTVFDFFPTALLGWYDPSRRPLAWKHLADPYLIWLSEIILQQTRAEQGGPYFEKFKQQYPTVGDLATAPEDEVMKLWEGLGYYSRARNLQATAQYIHQELGGQFPQRYEDILQLRGVGPYTAAAIASFAFRLPYAVVDGNVYRVLARFFDDSTPIDTTAGKRHYAQLAQRLLPPDQAATYNQAIMDLGATVCTPKAPRCSECPLAERCRALEQGTAPERPIKIKKLVRTTRYFQFLVVQHPDFRILEKRMRADIWRNLYQFPLLETADLVEAWSDLPTHPNWPAWLNPAQLTLQRRVGPRKQELTHQKIIATFWEINLDGPPLANLPGNFIQVKPKKWRKFAFPKVISCYFEDNFLYLF
ncbi:MAG: A/G-specific adenine glycosylase [Bacteroidetes bacterium]|nr:MAG: A/G-specific adenine glycosylase [Bacteroidota bacterium]